MGVSTLISLREATSCVLRLQRVVEKDNFSFIWVAEVNAICYEVYAAS